MLFGEQLQVKTLHYKTKADILRLLDHLLDNSALLQEITLEIKAKTYR